MSIRTKLILGFLGVSLIGALLGGIGIFSLSVIRSADTNSFVNGTQGLIVVLKVTEAFDAMKVADRDVTLASDEANTQKAAAAYREGAEKLNKAIAEYGTTISDGQDKVNYEALKAAAAEYVPFANQVLELGLQNKKAESVAIMQAASSAKIRSDMSGAVQRIADYNVKYTTDLFHQNLASEDLAILAMLIILGAGILFSILMGLMVTNSIVKPVRKVNDDLSAASRSLESASSQVSTSSQQLSSSSSELASSIEEMTSSLEELQSIVEANTKNVNQSELFMQETSVGSKKVTEGMVSLREALAGDFRSVEEDLQNHQSHRRHRLPDQHSGPQCRRRGGPGRGRGAGVCCGGRSGEGLWPKNRPKPPRRPLI